MWFWFGLGSAGISAVSLILNKHALKNINVPLVSWSLFAFSLPILFIISLRQGIPNLSPVFWLAAFSSALLFAIGKTISLSMIQKTVLSKIIPLSSFNTLFTYGIGLILLSEVIRPLSLAGLTAIIAGSYLLNADMAKEGFLQPFKYLLRHRESVVYVFTMFIYSASAIFDKIALLHMNPYNQSFYLLIGNTMITIMLTGYIFRLDGKWLTELRQNFGNLTLNGVVYTGVSLLYLYGITNGAVALVSGAKRMEIVFTLILSWLLFRDKPTKHIWIGTIIMLCGVILIKIG